jgi:toxin ParE1/3/4
MTARTTGWTVRLTQSAERDFTDIVHWSVQRFGPTQARIYAETVSIALQDLAATGPTLAGVVARDEISPGLSTLHVARNRRKGRHFILFRVTGRNQHVIDVLRILHDAMDLPRHVPPETNDA